MFGDTTTNRMASTAFSNIYRVLDTALTNTDRPLMAVVANIGTTLPAGTYWVDWQLSGTLASGPWAPPVTLVGQTGKPGANAVQNDGSSWIPAMDDGSGAQQDFPFLIEGTAGGGTSGCSSVSDIPWLSLNPTAGSTAAGASTPVTVTFNSTGVAAGSYAARLCVSSNDAANPVVTVPVSFTVTDGTGDPIAEITPDSLDFTVDAGSTGTDTMVIKNVGSGTLTYSIAESDAERLNPPSFRNNPWAKYAPGALEGVVSLSRSGSGDLNRFGEPVQLLATDISQMADNTPGDEGVACNLNDGSGVSDNSWWRRFYFNEHTNVGASANVVSVTISTGSTTLPGGVPSTINLYTIPHSVTVNTIPTGQLTLIGTANFTATGSLQSITVPVTGAITDTVGKDLVVEWHTDGATGGPFYPGANASAETHPTFLSSSGCGLNQPETATAIGFPDFHLTMVVTLDDGGSEPEACD
ncbi:MAG: hypothetical protein J0H15_14495, partial [Xanthomonadales bacterium]|nr:hypothetical protein [Xanthomonadales bacterium]